MQGLNCKKYFYCNRSGSFESQGKGLRSLKVQGTSKIGELCTSHIKLSGASWCNLNDDVTTYLMMTSLCHRLNNVRFGLGFR